MKKTTIIPEEVKQMLKYNGFTKYGALVKEGKLKPGDRIALLYINAKADELKFKAAVNYYKVLDKEHIIPHPRSKEDSVRDVHGIFHDISEVCKVREILNQTNWYRVVQFSSEKYIEGTVSEMDEADFKADE